MPEALSQLAQLRTVAFELGMAFGAQAKRTEDLDDSLRLFDAFNRCFAGVRIAIALELRSQRTPAERSERETEPDVERDPVERDRYDERDRDRETERASLPILLRTLEAVAYDAETLLDHKPAELPTLRELLARLNTQPAAGQPLRSRLTGSATSLPPPLIPAKAGTQAPLRPG